jgi:hypothetical protein
MIIFQILGLVGFGINDGHRRHADGNEFKIQKIQNRPKFSCWSAHREGTNFRCGLKDKETNWQHFYV